MIHAFLFLPHSGSRAITGNGGPIYILLKQAYQNYGMSTYPKRGARDIIGHRGQLKKKGVLTKVSGPN